MTPIQILLTTGVVLIALYMYVRIRKSVVDTVLIFLFLAVGILFILFPEITNKLAKALGVNRGINLIFYTGFLILLFLILKLYARSKRLEQNLTELVRKISLEKAEKLNED
ncbi:MAG: DUF2304 domain-containing protein [Segetibacter sp.]|jgi:hypothetical protein|nr:DUF2304 domain-containing protein [Segetibacter sp.]